MPRRIGRSVELALSQADDVAKDAELRPLRDGAHERLRTMMLSIAERLGEANLLRTGMTPEDAGATMFAIASDATYLRWAAQAGASPGRYADRLGDTLARVLLRA